MVAMTIWRWDNNYWTMCVVHTVITDTAEKCATQGSHTTGTRHN